MISNVTVTEERKELYDFSSYRNDQLGWLTSANSTIKEIKEPKDIAGLTVGVGSGTNQEKILLRLEPGEHRRRPQADQRRRAAVLRELLRRPARPAVRPRSTPTSARTRAAAYSAATAPDQYKVVGTLNGGWPDTAQIAVATLKGSGLAEAVTAALNHTIEDGTYAARCSSAGACRPRRSTSPRPTPRVCPRPADPP